MSVDANGESARLEVPYPFDRLRALIKKAGGLSDADIAETLFADFDYCLVLEFRNFVKDRYDILTILDLEQ